MNIAVTYIFFFTFEVSISLYFMDVNYKYNLPGGFVLFLLLLYVLF